MFAEIVKALLSGAFICPHTMKEAYDYLGNEERRVEVEAYLAKMDLSVRRQHQWHRFEVVI